MAKKKKGKFLQWLGGAVKKVPALVGAASKAVTGDVFGAFNEVKTVLSNSDAPELQELSEEFHLQEMEFEKEVFALEIQDRQSARELYKDDSVMQKAFGIVFLVAYIILSVYGVKLVSGQAKIPEFGEMMITMVWTATSTKLNTIIDFFFGGAFDNKKS